MYKPNYKQQMKDSAQTVEMLLPKALELYNITVELDKNLSDLLKEQSKTTDEGEKEALQEDIDKVSQSLSDMDAALCKKIAKNQFYTENNARLAAGRQNKKDGEGKQAVKKADQPAQQAQAAPASKPKAATTAQSVQVAATVEETTEQQIDQTEQQAQPGTTKKGETKKANDKDGKESKPNTKQIVGWSLAALGTGLLAFWGIPIPQLNKSSFSFRIRR